MTDGEKILESIHKAAVGEALKTWLNTPISTPISTPMEDRMDASIAAYERALIRPIIEAPKDGTPFLILDCNDGTGWCEDGWNLEFNDWDVCPGATPTHFRELPPETEIPVQEIPDAT